MKSKVKRKLRVLSLCLIAMFLLIPLLSQPVAAITSVNVGVVETEVRGPINIPRITFNLVSSPYNAYEEDEDHVIVFECDIFFTDYSYQPFASSHIATITVWLTSVNPPQYTGTDTTGTVYLGGSTGEYSYEDTLVVSEYYGDAPLPRIYSVTISVSVTDPNIPATVPGTGGPITVNLS
jgi:hypothetical protein